MITIKVEFKIDKNIIKTNIVLCNFDLTPQLIRNNVQLNVKIKLEN